MKIGFSGLDLPEGKVKYTNESYAGLVEKCQPAKLSPFVAEFLKDEFIQADAIVIAKEKLLDLLIQDMEKLELRLQNSDDSAERELAKKCMLCLEKEIPLCDAKFSDEENQRLRTLSPISMKPVIMPPPGTPANDIITMALEKSDMGFFYTAGPEEVHVWSVKKHSDIVICAGRIHTDLAKGFIKADIVTYEDFIKCHNMNDAKAKGVVKLVERDYLIGDADIVEIRFNL